MSNKRNQINLDGMTGYKSLRKRIENARQCMLVAKEYMEQHKAEEDGK